ncbi:hypothetical protein EDD86DRAFT_209734 [Gorgonomyces haynaldii]|nr:hypothetical protein EDD86DRAFT_209734 [Gorgonomyces haynaldii]
MDQLKINKKTSDVEVIASETLIGQIDKLSPSSSDIYKRRASNANIFMVGSPIRPSFEDHLFADAQAKRRQSERDLIAPGSPKPETASPKKEEKRPPQNPEKKTMKQMTKQERRELQDRQRAEKAAKQQQKEAPKKKPQQPSRPSTGEAPQRANLKKKQSKSNLHLDSNDKSSLLLSHLPDYQKDYKHIEEAQKQGLVHPAVLSLGRHILERNIAGGNARCVAMLLTFKKVIADYVTPPGVTLQRDLTQHISRQVDFLSKSRSLAASMKTAIRFLKTQVTKFSIDIPDADAKQQLCETIDNFISERIEFADQEIINVTLGSNKLKNGDVIMVFAKSFVVYSLLAEAKKRGLQFRVIVVDSRPFLEGKTMLQDLTKIGIQCTYILTHAIPYVIKEATKVILGASTVMTNGDVMSRTGTSIVAMAAYDAKVPVMVLCESYKFSDSLVRLDSFVWNEFGDPDLLANISSYSTTCAYGFKAGPLDKWRDIDSLVLVNLNYDITPAKFINMVACEHGLIPSTLVSSIIHQEESQ